MQTVYTYIHTYTHTHTYIIPTSALYREIEEETTQKLQKEWEDCSKAAITKQFFPSVHDRLKLKINITTKFTAMVTAW